MSEGPSPATGAVKPTYDSEEAQFERMEASTRASRFRRQIGATNKDTPYGMLCCWIADHCDSYKVALTFSHSCTDI